MESSIESLPHEKVFQFPPIPLRRSRATTSRGPPPAVPALQSSWSSRRSTEETRSQGHKHPMESPLLSPATASFESSSYFPPMPSKPSQHRRRTSSSFGCVSTKDFDSALRHRDEISADSSFALKNRQLWADQLFLKLCQRISSPPPETPRALGVHPKTHHKRELSSTLGKLRRPTRVRESSGVNIDHGQQDTSSMAAAERTMVEPEAPGVSTSRSRSTTVSHFRNIRRPSMPNLRDAFTHRKAPRAAEPMPSLPDWARDERERQQTLVPRADDSELGTPVEERSAPPFSPVSPAPSTEASLKRRRSPSNTSILSGPPKEPLPPLPTDHIVSMLLRNSTSSKSEADPLLVGHKRSKTLDGPQKRFSATQAGGLTRKFGSVGHTPTVKERTNKGSIFSPDPENPFHCEDHQETDEDDESRSIPSTRVSSIGSSARQSKQLNTAHHRSSAGTFGSIHKDNDEGTSHQPALPKSDEPGEDTLIEKLVLDSSPGLANRVIRMTRGMALLQPPADSPTKSGLAVPRSGTEDSFIEADFDVDFPMPPPKTSTMLPPASSINDDPFKDGVGLKDGAKDAETLKNKSESINHDGDDSPTESKYTLGQPKKPPFSLVLPSLAKSPLGSHQKPPATTLRRGHFRKSTLEALPKGSLSSDSTPLRNTTRVPPASTGRMSATISQETKMTPASSSPSRILVASSANTTPTKSGPGRSSKPPPASRSRTLPRLKSSLSIGFLGGIAMRPLTETPGSESIPATPGSGMQCCPSPTTPMSELSEGSSSLNADSTDYLTSETSLGTSTPLAPFDSPRLGKAVQPLCATAASSPFSPTSSSFRL